MALHNDEGEILWTMAFNSTCTTKQPESWFAAQRLISAEEDTIMEKKKDDLVLRFNESMISVARKNGRKWLSVEWSDNAGPKMAFSSTSARNPSDLSSVSYSANSERIKTESYDTYLTTGEEYKVFRPDYSSSDKQFFPVATTKAKSIGFNYTRLTYGNEIYFFIMSNHGELVEGIKKYLAVDKVQTSLYKRHQTSAVDYRGSAVVFGLLGLFLLLTVLLLVVLLDAATLGRHLKMMKFNTSHFRNFINLKLKRIKRSFKNKNAKENASDVESTQQRSNTRKSPNQTINRTVSVNVNKQDVATRIGSNHLFEKKLIKTIKRPNIAVTASSKQLDKLTPGIVRSSRNPTQKGSRQKVKIPTKP
ncbi:hypothetical protein LOTGIDRAFT_155109 [Lottia gigantea]|uniref:Uncharacterized protein n=1 Tax=Lottia gigantea TaxID=225164 RepID=V3ZSR8_LOTGI|nr:hypothetical protein LOTGIDRAFT_155109 [Lottia gigantea]ESO85620.1 hypothetical protein LOTGIDRAFT_155109 [Lottia gigantea]